MAVRIHIAPGLFPRQRSNVAWDVNARNLDACLDAIDDRFPGARQSLIDDRGRVRQQVRIYVDGDPADRVPYQLRGDEQVAIETSQTASRARALALSRFRRRTDADLEYERRYGPIKMEGPCSGGLGESIAFTGIGAALLVWSGGNVAFGSAPVGLSLILGALAGTVLLVWGMYNLYDDLFG